MSTRALAAGLALLGAAALAAQEPPWNPGAIKECDRACLVGIMDAYMNAIRDQLLFWLSMLLPTAVNRSLSPSPTDITPR
jgi:hypothetical protein